MQVGCGVYSLEIKGRPYLYFWHYETKAGRRRQVKEYLGAARSAETRDEAVRRCEAYYDRMAEELTRMRRGAIASMASNR